VEIPKYLSLSILTICLCIAQYRDARAEPVTREPSAPVQTATASQPVDAGRKAESIFLPTGHLFKALIADPKEPRFYLSYHPYQYGSQYGHHSTQIFSGGLGDMFGLYREVKGTGLDWQLDIGGGIFSEFDLNTSSMFLVSSDYVIGFPLTLRSGPASYRIFVYHQSSHLGDEYLLHNDVQRVEFSYEALNVIASYEWIKWRVYYGGEYLVHREPAEYKPATIQGGLEYYDVQQTIGSGRLVGGLDLKSTQENNWPVNASLKAGLQFNGPAGANRSLRVLLEGYKGFSPHSQFYKNRITYFGIGTYFEFE
jgi:hypothetical protein